MHNVHHFLLLLVSPPPPQSWKGSLFIKQALLFLSSSREEHSTNKAKEVTIKQT